VVAIVVALALAGGLGAVVAVGSGGHSPAVAKVGRPAPSWSAPTVAGVAGPPETQARHWTVLNFFATWCVPCQKETPELAAFEAAHRASGDARVVGVLYLDSASSARSFAASHSVTWPILGDAHGDVASRYQVSGLPQSFVIRPDGTLAARLFGAVTEAKLDAVVGVAT